MRTCACKSTNTTYLQDKSLERLEWRAFDEQRNHQAWRRQLLESHACTLYAREILEARMRANTENSCHEVQVHSKRLSMLSIHKLNKNICFKGNRREHSFILFHQIGRERVQWTEQRIRDPDRCPQLLFQHFLTPPTLPDKYDTPETRWIKIYQIIRRLKFKLILGD